MTEILQFIDASPSPYHAVRTMRARLDSAGFEYLPGGSEWRLSPGNCYYTHRAGKSLIAWRQGRKAVNESGFRILAGHTDSPCLKVKPNPQVTSGTTSLLSIDVYGSPLLYTWLDRDLKLAGVVHLDGDPTNRIRVQLIEVPEVRLRSPSLAIHLNRGLKMDGLKINPQTDLNLLIGQSGTNEANIASILTRALGSKAGQIHGYDLCLADTQSGSLIGSNGEFLSAPRLDNLFSCFCTMQALLIDHSTQDHTSVGVWFDAEEIGSHTGAGAGSNFLDATLLRISLGSGQRGFEDFLRAKANSCMMSVDMAHAEHPAFKDRTDENHVPMLNGGLAIKSAANGRYGDSTELAAWFSSACAENNLLLQKFSYRCDHGGGSSVGPMISASTGIKTIDAGAPMLSMHSIRELAGALDVEKCITAFAVFLSAPGTIADFSSHS